MGTKKLLIAAVLLAALSGVVWWSNKHPDWGKEKKAGEAETPTLFNVADSSIAAIDIQKKDGTRVTLDRQGGKWSITAPAAYPADQEAVSSIASSMSPVNADSVVDEKPTDLAKYGLMNPALTATIREKSGKSHVLQFGDEIPTASQVYLREGASPKVYAALSSLKTTFDKSVNDLRDKRLLTFDQNQLTRVQVGNIEFGKNSKNEWAIVQPAPYRADSFQVEELLRKLSDSKMDLTAKAEDQQKAEKGFASGKAVGIAKMTDSSGTQTFEVRRSGEDYYGKSSVVTGVHKVNADLGKQLEKQLEDYRNKKLFDFAFTDPTKVEINGKALMRTGSDWKRDGKLMDSASVQAMIDKLRELSATKFPATGFTTPVSTITVVSDDNKRTEKVEFAKTADGYIARRNEEPALYQLDAKSVDDILEASGKITAAKDASSKH